MQRLQKEMQGTWPFKEFTECIYMNGVVMNLEQQALLTLLRRSLWGEVGSLPEELFLIKVSIHLLCMILRALTEDAMLYL